MSLSMFKSKSSLRIKWSWPCVQLTSKHNSLVSTGLCSKAFVMLWYTMVEKYNRTIILLLTARVSLTWVEEKKNFKESMQIENNRFLRQVPVLNCVTWQSDWNYLNNHLKHKRVNVAAHQLANEHIEKCKQFKLKRHAFQAFLSSLDLSVKNKRQSKLSQKCKKINLKRNWVKNLA